MKQELQIGDRVRYSTGFLQSIGAYTGPLGFAKGTIVELQSLGTSTLAIMAWDGNQELPGKVNVANLEKSR